MAEHRPLPPRPDLAVRLAFAGSRALPEGAASRLETALGEIYDRIAERLAELAASGAAGTRHDAPPVVRFSPEAPLVRLISGLAEGADDLAARVLAATAARHRGVRFESAGVLAFPRESYRASRDASFRARFDELHDACAYVVELDGVHDEAKDSPRRQRAYRAQTTVLLRQADLLIAMTDASAPGRAGGTREAVRAALAFGLPVVLIDTATGASRIIGADEGVDDVLTRGLPAPSAAVVRKRLGEWITTMLADPDRPMKNLSPEQQAARHEYAALLLGEFFDDATSPLARRSFRRWLWRRFERFFAWTGDTAGVLGDRFGMAPPAESPRDESERRLRQEAPYQAFRARAAALSGYYAGLYRGAFLLNFGLAAVAVAVAALSLVVFGAGFAGVVGALAARLPAALASPEEAVTRATEILLFALGAVKLGILVGILRNTAEARRRQLNERAVDYRYLAERLRTLFYLPPAGAYQLAPVAAGYSARVVRQSAVDWLFDAIVRHVSPRALADAGSPAGPSTIQVLPVAAVRGFRDRWLYGQASYHLQNAERMRSMFTALEHAGRWLNIVVIGAVVLDLGIVVAGFLHVGPAALHGVTPWLLVLAALLPATVAAANGIRFQSECQRLAERSSVMVEIIAGRWKQADDLDRTIDEARRDRATDPGSWVPAALRLGESIAGDMMNEAAEWSVLYGKEIVET